MSDKLTSPVFRVSFPNVFEARAAFEGQTKKYSLTMLFDIAKIKADPSELEKFNKMKAALDAIAVEKWGDKMPKELKKPFRDGAEKEEYQGYGPGIIFVAASTTTKPGLVDQDLNRIMEPELFYAGCYARATLNAYAWSRMGKNGVSFGLQNIQKVADGEPFSGRTSAEDDFDAVGDGAGAEAAAGDPTAGLFD
jgi:hypothetical protein